MAQAILADMFPPEKRGLAFALYGVTAIIAPTIGPTLGGWITDNYTWRWIFFINLPVGMLALFLVYRLVEDPPWAKRVGGADALKFDYIGHVAARSGRRRSAGDARQGAGGRLVRIALHRHARRFCAAVGLVALVHLGVVLQQPDRRRAPFKNLNFLGANVMMFVLGILLFSSLVMMPLFLQSLMGYTAESAGLVLSGGGLLLLFLMPVVGVLSSKVQARYLVAFGWLALSLACMFRADSWIFRSAS